MNKKWAPIAGYEGRYEVSDTGDVRRTKKTVCGDIGSLLVPCDRAGYKMVRLCKDGTVRAEYIHRLVARAFCGERPGEVNHINGDKQDNRAENLEWCSHKENMKKAAETGLIKRKAVVQIENSLVVAVYPSVVEASEKTGVSKSNISKCCKGKRKTAGGYEWREGDGSE